MAEQQSGPFGPDVLTLQASESFGHSAGIESADADVDESTYSSVLLAPPTVALTAEADLEFYRRKQNMVAVRHVSGDEIVAVVESFHAATSPVTWPCEH